MSIWSPDSSTNSFRLHRTASFDHMDNHDCHLEDSSYAPILRVFSFDEWTKSEKTEDCVPSSPRVFSFNSYFDDDDDDDDDAKDCFPDDNFLRSRTMTSPTVLDERDDSSKSFIQVIGPSASHEVDKRELVPLDICTWTSSSSSNSPRATFYCDSIPRISDLVDEASNTMQTTLTHSNNKSPSTTPLQISQYGNDQVGNNHLGSVSSLSTLSGSTLSPSSTAGNAISIPKVIVVSNVIHKHPRRRAERGGHKKRGKMLHLAVSSSLGIWRSKSATSTTTMKP